MALASGLNLVIYLGLLAYGGDILGIVVPWKPDVLGIMVILTGAFFKLDIKKIFEWWKEWRKRRKEDRNT